MSASSLPTGSTLAGPIQTDLGLSDREKARVLGAFFLTYALFQIPMGTLADRYGARKVLAVMSPKLGS